MYCVLERRDAILYKRSSVMKRETHLCDIISNVGNESFRIAPAPDEFDMHVRTKCCDDLFVEVIDPFSRSRSTEWCVIQRKITPAPFLH